MERQALILFCHCNSLYSLYPLQLSLLTPPKVNYGKIYVTSLKLFYIYLIQSRRVTTDMLKLSAFEDLASESQF